METMTLRQRMEMDFSQGKRKVFIWVFFINLIVTVFTYGLFFQFKFAVDTYKHIYMSTSDFLLGHIGMGRPLAAAICIVLKNLGLNDGLHQIPYVIFLTLSIAVCSTVIYIQLIQHFKSNDHITEILVDLISLLPFINVFFCSWYMYTEASILTGAGALLAVFGAVFVNNGKQKKRNYILSALCVFLSICLYQAFMAFFVILACTFVMVKHKLKCKKESVLEIVSILIIAVVSIILNQIITNYLCNILNLEQSARTATFDLKIIGQNISNVISFQHSLWIDSLNLLPRYTLFVFLMLIIVLWITSIIKLKTISLMNVLMCIAVIIGSYILVFAPHLVSPVFWPAERTLYPLFMFASLILCMFLCSCNSNTLKTIALFICLSLFIINVVEIQDMASDQQKVNSIDKEYALLIGQTIDEYEKETGVIITNIGLTTDQYPTYGYYSQVDKIIYDTNITAKSHPWCFFPMLKYYLNRDFTLVNIPEEVMKQSFFEKNWNGYVPSEQIVFENNSVYICSY